MRESFIKTKWPYLVLAGAILLAYSNCFRFEFLFDDEFLIQKNWGIRSFGNFLRIFQVSSQGGAGGVDDFYRPMQTLAYLITFQIGGLSPVAFHILNLTLHITAACLFFALGLEFGLSKTWALLVGLIWALHPVHTEAVTYMSATADTLYALFCLASCLLMMKATSWRLTALALLMGIFALLTKESAVVLPGLIMVSFYVQSVRRNPGISLKELALQLLKKSAPFWAVVAVYLVLRATALNFRNTFNIYHTTNIYTENISYRLYTALATLPSYAEFLLFPHDLHMERNFPVYVFWAPPVILGALMVGALFGLAVRGIRKRAVASVLAPLWFLGAHFPHTGILVPVNAFILEHWMYLPSMGLAWGLGLKARRGIWVAVGIAVLLGVATFQQNWIWSDPITFYNHLLRYSAGTPRVHNNLGMAYSDVGDFEKAIAHYKKASELEPTLPNPKHNLAHLYLEMGQTQAAIEQLESAILVDPRFYHSLRTLAEIYQKLGDTERAKQYFERYEETRRIYP